MGGKIKGILKYIYLALLLFISLTPPLPSYGSSPQELLQVGTGAFKDGFYQVAEAQFREFLQVYPQHTHAPKVMYLLGKALYEQKKFVEAKEVFAKLLKSKTNLKGRDATYFWLARSCEEVNDLSCAKSSLLTIVKKYPQGPWYLSSLYLLGKVAFQQGQYKRSEAYLRKALKDRKITPHLSCCVKFWLGLTLYGQGRHKEAEGLFQKVVNSEFKEGPREEALYWLGETQIKVKKYKKGVETFHSFLEGFPHSPLTPNALYGESWCLYMCGRREEALKGLLALKKGFPHTPLLPQVLSLMGEAYIGLDRYQEAIEVLKEFLSRFPQDQRRGQSLLNLGWCHLKLGDLAQVKEIAYEIVKLPPGERERALAQYILAELNYYERKYQEAMPYWFNLLNTPSYRQEALFKIAICFFREGKFRESLVNLDLLQLEYPNFKKMDEALWIKGESFSELGDLSEAGKAYQRVIKEYKRSPWYPWSIYRMITILLDKGDLDRGERWFKTLQKEFTYHELSYEAALKLGIWKAERVEYKSSLRYLDIAVHSPDKRVAQNALCWQGEIYFNLKEYQKALERYQRVVAESPSPGDALAAVAYLEMGNIKHLLDDQEGAKEAYKKAIEISGDEEFIDKVKGLLKELKETKEGGA
ncbi:MAG: tetratricopeptide repeat protein [Deltaproteobacteria bacterium]|nr:tetratricopeptide repeat protein [Deltaproteobacteria bacterium]